MGSFVSEFGNEPIAADAPHELLVVMNVGCVQYVPMDWSGTLHEQASDERDPQQPFQCPALEFRGWQLRRLKSTST